MSTIATADLNFRGDWTERQRAVEEAARALRAYADHVPDCERCRAGLACDLEDGLAGALRIATERMKARAAA